jgi:transcriptional regulator with XRE-family HTH domain
MTTMPDPATPAPQWGASDWQAWLETVGLGHHGGRAEVARRLGISREHMSRLLSGKALSSETLELLAATMTDRRRA